MKWIYIVLSLLLLAGFGELGSGGGDFGHGGITGSPGFVYGGPGDLVASANMWVGLRAYSNAKTGTKIANVCNATDANCADINSLSDGRFDVATSQSSPLNCGGAGGTCTIKTFYDQSGGTNCTAAACDLTQATIASRATLVFNCIGSKPCAAGAGAAGYVTAANSSGQAQPLTVSWVAERTGNFATLQSMFGVPNMLVGFDGANTSFVWGGSVVSDVAATDSAFHAFQSLLNGASSMVVVDGVSLVPSANPGTTGTAGAVLNLFSQSSIQNVTGQFVEAGMWNGNFSAAQSAAMNSNQRAFWGF